MPRQMQGKKKKDAQPFLALNSACYSTLNNKLKQSLAYIAEETGSQWQWGSNDALHLI